MNPKSVAIGKFKVLWVDQRDRKLRHHSQLTSFYSIHIIRDFAEVYPAILRTDVHLIVICLTTPKKKTIQLCREIKLCSDHKHIPIILMDDGPIDEETECVALLNGADLVIASSVSFLLFKAKLDSLLSNRCRIHDYYLHALQIDAQPLRAPLFMKRLTAAIDSNVTDMELTVEGLAKLMNVSRATLYRKLDALTGLSPSTLIKRAKLKRAALMLSQGDYTVKQISTIIGYSVSGNFSRDFKSHYGVRPSAYMKNSRRIPVDEMC